MTRALWVALVVCVAIGVVAAVARTTMLEDYVTRMEPLRQRIFAALGRHDPPGTDRLAVAREVDTRFAERPRLTLMHVVPGGLFLLFAPLQLSKRVRRNLTFHRWNGRVLITLGLLSVLPGLFFGIAMPFGGRLEGVAIALTGTLFVFALGRAYVAIRAKRIEVHREWMLRAVAVALGISVVRLAAAVYDPWLSPAGWSQPAVFVISLWTGWMVSIGVAESWIRYTRPGWSRT